jgi:FKBP-type peptidyl-prolyl cis-trans isomerase
MKMMLTNSAPSEPKNRIETQGANMNLANPMLQRSNRPFHMVLTVLVLSFLLSAAAQADDFQIVKGGMQTQDMQTGTGLVAAKGMVATIHFTAWLDKQGVRDKEVFNTRMSGRTVSFVIGTDKVMPAWNAGVPGMQVGGKRLLLVPPQMAYGERAIDDVIPAGSSMQFIIELVGLKE